MAAGFNFNVEEWDAAGQHYETLAICRSLALARPRSRLRSPRSPPAGSPWQPVSRCGDRAFRSITRRSRASRRDTLLSAAREGGFARRA
jgi:hypothetical protein